MSSMTSSRPYLVRAIHEWLVDNSLTPQLLVDAQADGVSVPRDYVQDGKIVLNVSTTAIRDFLISNEWVNFSARFGGKPFTIEVPIRAVLAVYAAENGVGMAFQGEDEDNEPPQGPEDKQPARPNLRVVR
jgi:stringent starvation protein B